MKNILLFILMAFSLSTQSQIIINEIMYNPPETGGDTLEYVELYNAGDADIDMTGYYFSNGVELSISGVTIPAKGFALFSERPSAVQAIFGVSSTAWDSGALNNAGEKLELSGPDSLLIDLVDYDDNNGWPEIADGEGPSIELIATHLDNDLGINWQASTTSSNMMINGFEVLGSPGVTNTTVSGIVKIAEHLVTISPNPAQLEVFVQSDLEITNFEIYSMNGQLLLSAKNVQKNQGVNISQLPDGLHVLRILTPKGLWQGRIFKLAE